MVNAPLSDMAIGNLQDFMDALLRWPADCDGTLEIRLVDEVAAPRGNSARLDQIITTLAAMAERDTKGKLTVRQADSDLVAISPPPEVVVMALCSHLYTLTDRDGMVIDYLNGMKLFRLGPTFPEVLTPATSNAVRQRREDDAASHRWSDNVAAAQYAANEWIANHPDSKWGAKLDELRGSVMHAIPRLGGTERIDAVKLLRKIDEQTDSIETRLVFAFAAAMVAGIIPKE